MPPPPPYNAVKVRAQKKNTTAESTTSLQCFLSCALLFCCAVLACLLVQRLVCARGPLHLCSSHLIPFNSATPGPQGTGQNLFIPRAWRSPAPLCYVRQSAGDRRGPRHSLKSMFFTETRIANCSGSPPLTATTTTTTSTTTTTTTTTSMPTGTNSNTSTSTTMSTPLRLRLRQPAQLRLRLRVQLPLRLPLRVQKRVRLRL